MIIDRSTWAKGDRITWFEQPKRERFQRTGTIAGVHWSKRTGLAWAVEVDPDGRHTVVKPEHSPFLLIAFSDVRPGSVIRLPDGGHGGIALHIVSRQDINTLVANTGLDPTPTTLVIRHPDTEVVLVRPPAP